MSGSPVREIVSSTSIVFAVIVPLELILPEAVRWPVVPDRYKDPVIT